MPFNPALCLNRNIIISYCWNKRVFSNCHLNSSLFLQMRPSSCCWRSARTRRPRPASCPTPTARECTRPTSWPSTWPWSWWFPCWASRSSLRVFVVSFSSVASLFSNFWLTFAPAHLFWLSYLGCLLTKTIYIFDKFSMSIQCINFSARVTIYFFE